jgi:hypothetical protein
MLRVMETLETHGWSLFSNTRLRIEGGNAVVSLSNGWFCIKDKQWVSGMAIIR